MTRLEFLTFLVKLLYDDIENHGKGDPEAIERTEYENDRGETRLYITMTSGEEFHLTITKSGEIE